MSKKKTLTEKFNGYLFDHLVLKTVYDHGKTLIMCFLSAFIFAFGLKTFLSPSIVDAQSLVSGGASGISQIFGIIGQLLNLGIDPGTIYMVCYILINIPLVILAFRGIGKRFAIYTMLNVAFVAILGNYLNFSFMIEIAEFVIGNGGLLARALFAGMCTGLSSAIAFKAEISAGGIDIISYYVSLKKSTQPGKYGVMVNSAVVVLFAFFSTLHLHVSTTKGITEIIGEQFAGILFSVIYMFTSMIVVDTINLRNKKVQVQIITDNPDLSKFLIANVPHGATIVKAKGGYTGNDKYIIYMVISTMETKKVVKLVRETDPKSFIYITDLRQVYGSFFIKPVK